MFAITAFCFCLLLFNALCRVVPHEDAKLAFGKTFISIGGTHFGGTSLVENLLRRLSTVSGLRAEHGRVENEGKYYTSVYRDLERQFASIGFVYSGARPVTLGASYSLDSIYR